MVRHPRVGYLCSPDRFGYGPLPCSLTPSHARLSSPSHALKHVFMNNGEPTKREHETAKRYLQLTQTDASILTREDVVTGTGAIHLLLVRNVKDVLLDGDPNWLGKVGAVVLGELGG